MTIKCSICHSPMYLGNICPKCSMPPAKEKADDRLHPTAGSPSSMFDADILSRAVMDNETAEKFRQESKQIVLRDPETEYRVVCYRHPDGRVLVDAIRLPENAKGMAVGRDESPPAEKSL